LVGLGERKRSYKGMDARERYNALCEVSIRMAALQKFSKKGREGSCKGEMHGTGKEKEGRRKSRGKRMKEVDSLQNS